MRAAFALAIFIGTTWTALAGSSSPNIMIPGRPGVPIIINGVDASYAVVEGDWGLGKGIHVQPTVYGGRLVDPDPHVGHYYPSSGHLPGVGRLEIEPPSNGKAKPAESFHQSWSAESNPPPLLPTEPAVPFYPPPVVTAPQFGGGGMPQDPANPPQDFRKPRRPSP